MDGALGAPENIERADRTIVALEAEMSLLLVLDTRARCEVQGRLAEALARRWRASAQCGTTVDGIS